MFYMEQPIPGGDRVVRTAPGELVAEIAERLLTCETTRARYIVTRELCENLYLIMLTMPKHLSLRDLGLDEFITSKILGIAHEIAKTEIPLKDDSLRSRFAHFQELFQNVGETVEELDTTSPETLAEFSEILAVAHSRIYANPEVVEAIEGAIPSDILTNNLETALKALQPIENWQA